MRLSLRDGRHAGAAILAAGIAMVISAAACGSRQGLSATNPVAPLGTTGAPSTSRADLDRTIGETSARLSTSPGDVTAAVRLADALLRQTRVTGNPSLALKAEQVLIRALTFDGGRYEVRRMLAAVYLSQHRFRDAIKAAEQALSARPRDEWSYGVLGDAHIELGEYDQAFDAFDRMNALKPSAASYARTSYARQLQGDLEGATRFMQMATEATPASDPESLAWHHAQLGYLWLERGRAADAERELAHADALFPRHPLAAEGLARVAEARGRYESALGLLAPRLNGPTVLPSDLAFAGDLLAQLGHKDEAERHYRLAEASWRADVPEPTLLARFLAEHDRRPTEALETAEQAWSSRRDIFTADAMAWAHYRLGHLDQARAFMAQALRTGTRDRVIRAHAVTLQQASASTHNRGLTSTKVVTR